MTAVLLQVHELTPVQRAVRNQFQEGGSTGMVLLMIAGILSLALVTYWLTRRLQENEGARVRPDDPKKLYRDLLDKLDLPSAQRRALDTVARDLRLQNPAKIFLSPFLFDRCMDQWGDAGGRAGLDTREGPSERLVAQIRTALFPPVGPSP
ncbi:MAG: hypothetical protein ACYTFA_06290 [Planctomycetota bacterium]|jgi:hypothetical protein